MGPDAPQMDFVITLCDTMQGQDCPEVGDKPITVVVRKIATRGEYAGWRATRATGDFDLRTFEVRAYPVDAVPHLRPGMSVYADWKRR